MSNYGNLKNRVVNELNRRDLTAEASAAVQTAIAFYETKRFWFNEQRALFTCVESQDFYGLPSDYAGFDSVKIRRPGVDEFLLTHAPWLDLEEFVTNDTPSTGIPEHFALYANQIRVFPAPNATAMVLVLSYVKRLASLTSDADANEWTRLAEGLIRARAEKDIAANVLHDSNLAAVYDVFVKEEERRLNQQTISKITVGTYKRGGWPTGNWW